MMWLHHFLGKYYVPMSTDFKWADYSLALLHLQTSDKDYKTMTYLFGNALGLASIRLSGFYEEVRENARSG